MRKPLLIIIRVLLVVFVVSLASHHVVIFIGLMRARLRKMIQRRKLLQSLLPKQRRRK